MGKEEDGAEAGEKKKRELGRINWHLLFGLQKSFNFQR